MDVKHLSNEEKLNHVYEMVYENNQILKSLRRQQYFATFLRIVYWLAILGVIGGAYFYIRPVVGALSTNAANVDQRVTQFNQITGQLPETKFVNQIFDWLKKSITNPQ